MSSWQQVTGVIAVCLLMFFALYLIAKLDKPAGLFIRWALVLVLIIGMAIF